MKETLKKWVEEKKEVEVFRNDDGKEVIYGRLVLVDEKFIHLQGECLAKIIIPWKKIATIRECLKDKENPEEFFKMPYVRIYFNGPLKTTSMGFFKKDTEEGIITVYHDGRISIHPMHAIKGIIYVCEAGQDT